VPRELILTFHGIGEPPDWIGDAERSVWVPVEWYQAIVDALPPDGVSLAFDDGNDSDVRAALPALAQGKRTARFFPLVGRLGMEGYLSAEDLAQLSEAGMQIGSHGVAHRDWRTLDDGELEEELSASRRTLAGIVGSEIVTAACPFGSYDRRVLRALRAAGYRRVFTSDGGRSRPGAWLSSRTTVHRDRPLQEWLQLLRTPQAERDSLLSLGKRIYKRVR